ncbi:MULTISPECIES: surface-adhesin E family protein [unclassified Polaromonas]|uniref:surface-adhesin E family protein n=1 Tax=unclassified Polaromonas TaxID=2638319 RepID=UPI0018C9471E|nr:MULTISPECIES: surface-adhesin E family protein [unclassified Polaromonas]MBG6072012.1 hypothetical protein [Polaromonas sp. CG_9.7]MBG6114015.1 hypothetical protein [Polaromonas sp. CG_9.2]MDH6184900.1 hypothetical protein [Polaromonas sp. CG_23.6]
MKTLIMVCCLWCCTLAQAGTEWFNVMGDAANESVNTIEVDPSPVSINPESRIMRVRVSRSEDRVNWDGVPYRSFVSDVLFDCSQATARYLSIDYYRLPAWKGEPYLRRVYPQTEPRMMLFREVEPNPYRRIIRAACQTSNIINN